MSKASISECNSFKHANGRLRSQTQVWDSLDPSHPDSLRLAEHDVAEKLEDQKPRIVKDVLACR